MTQESAETTGMSFTPPTSAIADGEWLVVSITKLWTTRNARKGSVDPSGGITVEPSWNSELLLALPLVDKPTKAKPDGTLTMEELEQKVITRLSNLNNLLVKIDTLAKDF